MAASITNYKCPACTGPLKFNGEKNKLECEYCGSLFTEEEVKAAFGEKDEAAAAKVAADEEKAAQKASSGDDAWDASAAGSEWGEDANKVKVYNCPSCGADLIFDETTVATSCPYCDNPTVVPSNLSGALKPDYVIPFKLEKKAAVEALKNHYKGKKLLPNSFTEGNRVEEIKGVYVPFWLFDGKANADVTYDAEKVDIQETDDERIITTEYYKVRRAGSLSFEKIPVDASTNMPDDHMDSIEPYDYSEMKEFSTAYLPGFMADKYDVSVEESSPRADLRAKNSVLAAMRSDVTGYDSVSPVTENVNLKRGQVKYALMPVWMLSTKWNDQNFLFAMNGQTGKLVGDLPADKGKFWKYFFITLAISLAAVLAVMFIFLGGYAEGTGGKVAATIIIPALVAFIRGLILKGELNSVFTATHAEEYIKGKASFTIRDDKYIRTDVRREKKEKPQENK